MKINYQSRYLGVNNILKYLNKELKKYNKKYDKIVYMYKNNMEIQLTSMYKDDRYTECVIKTNYLHKLIKKIKEGKI